MIDSVQNMISNVKSFDNEKDLILISLVKDKERNVIDFNVENLFSGSLSDGTRTRPGYAESTKRRKQRKNQPYDRVTLRDEGDFHESFFITYGDDFFKIDSDDQKRIYLEKRYGNLIYGLTTEDVDKLIGLIKDSFILKFRETILQ